MTNTIDWEWRARVADGVLDTTGLTPAVRLGRIATIINDSGLRYLSTELCGDAAELEVPDRPHELDPALAGRLHAAALEVVR
jgi:hypothetical protein